MPNPIIDILVNTNEQYIDIVQQQSIFIDIVSQPVINFDIVQGPVSPIDLVVSSTDLIIEEKSDYVSPFNYIGKAVFGSLESQAVWKIVRLEISLSGTILSTSTISGVKWTDRLILNYP